MQKDRWKTANRVLVLAFCIFSLWLLSHYIFFSIGENRFYGALPAPTQENLKRARSPLLISLKIFPYNRKALGYLIKIDGMLDGDNSDEMKKLKILYNRMYPVKRDKLKGTHKVIGII